MQKIIQSGKRKISYKLIREHTGLPGPVALGNSITDLLTKVTLIASMVEQTLESHDLHHQNALALRRMFSGQWWHMPLIPVLVRQAHF